MTAGKVKDLLAVEQGKQPGRPDLLMIRQVKTWNQGTSTATNNDATTEQPISWIEVTPEVPTRHFSAEFSLHSLRRVQPEAYVTSPTDVVSVPLTRPLNHCLQLDH